MMSDETRAKPKRCRHRGSWILGGHHEWCWACGALRRLTRSGVWAVPASDWAYPQGQNGTNPWPKFQKSITRRGTP